MDLYHYCLTGLMMGNSLYVTPSCHETESSDESDNADLNALSECACFECSCL